MNNRIAHLTITAEMLLSMCVKGARLINGDLEAVCTQGFPDTATILNVEIVPPHDVRIWVATDAEYPEARWERVK